MSTASKLLRYSPAAAAAGLILSLGSANSLGSAKPSRAAAADLNPAAVVYKLPSQITWTGRPGAAETATVLGDPSKPGLYIQLVKWYPHNMSHPHFHPNDRYITVLSGTWWVGTGTKFDPDSTVPMPAGSYVVDLAKQVHYDGAKDETAVLEIVGEGPATITPAEVK
ncbi:MAG TPA: cupin domain-containing protein [Candidatus Acidoferrales bacterium]|nr:cupin domain-containing protein [Candidatus Acidoferrales bacterium]